MSKYRNKNLLFLGLILVISLVSIRSTTLNSSLENYQLEKLPNPLPLGFNDLFAASGECALCHGYDFAQMANVTAEGEDVNMIDGWRSTMMANSARDPFWQAKVSHEVSLNPDLQVEIESGCTDCHAPLGFFNAKKNGQDTYTMDEMNADPIAMDGVSCLACHQQSPDSLDIGFSGNLHFVDTVFAYGPYESPLVSPMASVSTYIPTYSDHVNDAALCSSCHSLQTNTINDAGVVTDNVFVEQATYHEWLNSTYSDDDQDITCQSCHMPDLGEEAIRISAIYDVNPRTPYYLHDLVGGNVHMLNILKDNGNALGVTATNDHFDKTIDKTYSMLQNGAMNLDLQYVQRTEDTASYSLKITNLAGHRFPSGYPSRRLVVEFILKEANGDTLFHSGKFNENQYVIGEDVPYETHHDLINNEEQVQIYEMVMGKENGDYTTILTYAHHPLKDNRLVPLGFSTSHIVYDTTLIAGLALTDINFNHLDGVEGSGTDNIDFRIPINGSMDSLIAITNVYYQSIPPKWMEEMFATNTPKITIFEAMYNDADLSPILVSSDQVELGSVVGISENQFDNLEVVFNASKNKIEVRGNGLFKTNVYNIEGKLIAENGFDRQNAIDVSGVTGIVLVRIISENGQSTVRKVAVF